MSTEIGAAPATLPAAALAFAPRGAPGIGRPGPPGVATEDVESLHATLTALAIASRRALGRPRDADGRRELVELARRLDQLRERVGPGPRLEPLRTWADNLRRRLLDAAGA